MLITMPQLGETVTEGTIVEWFKGVEVFTDKVDTEIPSPVAGIVSEILVAYEPTLEEVILPQVADIAAAAAHLLSYE